MHGRLRTAHRRNKAGVMCSVVKYTYTCTGCSCDIMEADKNGIPLGMGCHECGFTGKRRHCFYIPLNIGQLLAKAAA